jgi:hypothetical protein
MKGQNVNSINHNRASTSTKQNVQKQHHQKQTFRKPKGPQLPKSQRDNKTQKCRNCGNQWHASCLKSCPAWGKDCGKCGKLNHFAKVSVDS